MKKIFTVVMILLFFVAGFSVFGGGQKGVEDGAKERIIRVAMNEDLEDFDPHTDSFMMYRQVYRHMLYDTLVGYDKDLKMEGRLAESWDLKDATTYVFHLRKGVKFHNGKDFKAEDVKYTFERVLDVNTGSFLSVDLEPVKEVVVVDDYTVEVKLKSVAVEFLDNIVTISIVPNDPTLNHRREPIGTGPYKFSEYIANDRTVFARFEDYWDQDHLLNDGIEFKIIPDEQIAATNLAGGTVDVLVFVSMAIIDNLKSYPNVKVNMVEETTDILFFPVNASRKPLDDVRVRRAMAHCFDYEGFKKVAYKGIGRITNNPISPSMFAYKDVGLHEYDPAKAKQMLAEAGYPDGIEVTIEVLAGYDRYEQMSVVWKDGLEKAGIKTNLNVTEAQVWLDKFVTHNYDIIINETATRASTFGFFNTSLIGDGLTLWFKNKDEIEAKIREPNMTIDEAKRADQYKALQQWFFDDVPGAFLFYNVPYIYATTDKLSGITINAIGDWDFRGAVFE